MTRGAEARTATFLMTDIEGSTRLWEEQREQMAVALEAHDGLLRAHVEAAGGLVVKTTGDGVMAVFERPGGAIRAAVESQRALAGRTWPTSAPVRVRMAIHSGSVEQRDGDYFGPTLNRLARLLALGHGDQVLVSGAGAALVEGDLPDGVRLADRGEHPLRDLDRPERVFQLLAPDLRRDFPPLRSTATRTNLPAELTSFVGREREIAEVERLLLSHRLVSLVGVGGTGKTRLLLRVAEGALGRPADGVWLVELAPVTEPALIAEEAARSLSIPELPGRPILSAVVDFMRDKDLLLLLDNCEHLINDVARLVEQLLEASRGLRVATTSREALGVPGEAVFAVPSLGLPELPSAAEEDGSPGDDQLEEIAASEAVRLFVDRARAILPGFRIDAQTGGPIVEICRRLDGIPLAIELAAARVNVLSVAEIAQGLGDRFRLLTGGRRTSVPRQQTLQALIDWSWDLLSEADQRLLRRLSVFTGGWSLESAAEVTADDDGGGAGDRLATLDGLGRLADRSLVVVEHGIATRYRMLETIRQYAREKLIAAGEAVELRDRHLALFGRMTREAGARMEGPELPSWLARLDVELENIRSALDWAFEADPETALEMAVALAQFWRHRPAWAEGPDRMWQAVQALDGLPAPDSEKRRERESLAARVLAVAAMSAAATGRRQDMARGWSEEAVRRARAGGDRRTLSLALTLHSLALSFSGPAAAEELLSTLDEAMPLAQELGEWSRASFMAAGRAMYAGVTQRDPDEADRWLARATDAAHRSGDPSAIAFAAISRGRVLGLRGDVEGARPWFTEAIATASELRDRPMELMGRSELAHALRRGGVLAEAEAEYRQTINDWRTLGQRGAVADQLESFAYMAEARGEPHRAAVLLGAAEGLREVAGAQMLPHERAEYERQVAHLRASADAGLIARGWAEGRSLSMEDAVTFARAC